jgi:L-threonylcarbamoyladenylate synthase
MGGAGANHHRIKQAVETIESGGLVIIPTETFYGIACDALSEQATDRLARLKSRDGKPVGLIAGDVSHITPIAGELPPLFHDLAMKFWPGPLTMIVPAGEALPETITAGSGTVGIRIPGPSFALELARAFGGCLTATSANFAGKPPPADPGDLDPELAAAVEMVIDGGKTPGGEPSTLLDITSAPPAVLRPGPLGSEINRFLLT